MEEKKARIPARHTGASAHSGGAAPLPSCVSLFIHRSADGRKCSAPNESHARTWHVSEKKRSRKRSRESGRAGVNEVRREEEVIKKEILEKRKRRRRWCGGNSQRNLISLLSRLKWKKHTHTSLRWIKTGWYKVSWFLSTFLEGKSWAFGGTSSDEGRISTSWNVPGGLVFFIF